MGFSPAVGILHSYFPRRSPSPPAVSGDDVRVCHLFFEDYIEEVLSLEAGGGALCAMPPEIEAKA